jgi:hypothetical protein
VLTLLPSTGVFGAYTFQITHFIELTVIVLLKRKKIVKSLFSLSLVERSLAYSFLGKSCTTNKKYVDSFHGDYYSIVL